MAHKPLALRCQTPTDFIATLVEHHRSPPGAPQPAQSTLLLFVGLDEHGVLGLMDDGDGDEEGSSRGSAAPGPPPLPAAFGPSSSPPDDPPHGDTPTHTPSPSPSTTPEDATYPTPTLAVLSAAAHIDILYLADLHTLLTFLTHLQHSPPAPCCPPAPSPLLAIWNLTAAHHPATLSAAGLSRTLSLAADAAADSGRCLLLGEGGGGCWLDAAVPVLAAGAGATLVTVADVVGRWCRFAEDL